MVPHGQPFTEAAVDDWIRLQKSGELRLEAEGDSVVYVNPTLDDVRQSTLLRFVKIGLDGGMARYAHDTARYKDLILRKVPFQNASVIVRVVREALDNSPHVECLLDGYGLIYNSTHSASERLRGWQLRDSILKALRSGWQASRNTKIVLTRAGSTDVLEPGVLVWIPPDSSLQGISSTFLKKRPSAANDMPNRKKPHAAKVRPSAATESHSVKKRPAAASHATTETSASSSVPAAAMALR